MKLLFDLFPVILFFIAYKTYDIYVATAVIIVASILQVGYVYLKQGRIEKMHIITLVLVLLLGGLTLILQDETFIKWKPTIVNWGFALIFLGSHYIGQKPIVQRMMDQAIQLPNPIWYKLSWMWIGFFIFSGILNLYVAYRFDTDTWVNFKLFGLMGLTFVFIILQGLYISRYLKEDKPLQETLEESTELLTEIELDANTPKDPLKKALETNTPLKKKKNRNKEL